MLDMSRKSLGQMQIARWPHDGCGIDLGHLGSETPSDMLRMVEPEQG
jgi:hypothetical protein